MDLQARLDELKDDDSFGLLFVAPSGARVVDTPRAFARLADRVHNPEFPLDLAASSHHAVVATAFSSALSNGFSSVAVASADTGTMTHVELYNEIEEHGCLVIVLHDDDGEREPAIVVDDAKAAGSQRATMRIDPSGRILAVDDNYELMFGFRAEDVQGTAGGERVHPDDSPLNTQNWANALRNPGVPQRFRQRSQRIDGSWVWGDFTMTNRLHLDEAHMLVEIFDIDTEMQLRLAEQERQALLVRITDALPVGVVQLGANDSVALSNQRWTELTGQPSLLVREANRSDSAPLPERVFDAFGNSEEVEQICRAVARTGQDRTVRVLIADDSSVCTHGDLQIRQLTDELGAATLLLTLTDVSEAVALQARLEFEARNDHLTSILNRQGLEEHIDLLLTEQSSRERELAMLYLDLDGFKLVNDLCGHRRGDEVLQQLASRLSDLVREDDLIGRLGGDEFVVIALVESRSEAQTMQRRIQSRLRIEVQPGRGEPILVTASVGVAIAERDDTFHSLTNRADAAMYRFKDRRSTDPA